MKYQVILKAYTLENCHALYKKYVPDTMMTYDSFTYSEEKMTEYYDSKTADLNRRMFAISVNDEIIGEVQIKKIDDTLKEGTLSILIANDQYKNKGYGSEAEKLILEYAFHELKLKVVKADATFRNSRSKHVLEKLGFIHLKDENDMSYYELERDVYESQTRNFRK